MHTGLWTQKINIGLPQQARPAVTSILLIIPLIFASPALAASLRDPFGTESDLPPHPVVNCRAMEQGATMDLVAAVDVALCNNPQTRSAWSGARASAAGLGQAQSAYLPSLSANADADYNHLKGPGGTSGSTTGTYNSRGAGITLSYMLYDFGGREAAVESARQQMMSAGWNYNSVMQQLVFQVTRGYLDVFTTQESLDAAKKSEEASRQAFDAAKAKLDLGVVTPADTAQAETAYSQSQLTREEAENKLLLARGAFATLLHLPPTTEFSLAPVNPEEAARLDGKVEDMIRQALSHRPDLEALRAREKGAQADLARAKSKDYPSVSLTGADTHTDYSRNSLGSANDRSIGVRLSVPIFTGFSNTYQIDSARHTMQEAAAERSKAEDEVSLDVWNSYHNYQTSLRTYTTAQVLLKSAEASEALALGRYKQGKGTLLDALTAQAALASARNQWVAARYNTLTTRFDLLRALGSADWVHDISAVAPAQTPETQTPLPVEPQKQLPVSGTSPTL